jgi:hypothetical protein
MLSFVIPAYNEELRHSFNSPMANAQVSLN